MAKEQKSTWEIGEQDRAGLGETEDAERATPEINTEELPDGSGNDAPTDEKDDGDTRFDAG
ncbi:hypothetical protein [Haematomicrobium sanguinis]|uniref:hypothetical protein n=1 Tax=Haematomicrobium sanguinis TaxID=479106 RepID=UPI00054FA90F|nr:hypothetical protein [Haematomicrobium sanguinis]